MKKKEVETSWLEAVTKRATAEVGTLSIIYFAQKSRGLGVNAKQTQVGFISSLHYAEVILCYFS